MKDFRKGESGQILVITALGMTVLFGCMAIAIDIGLLFNAKRKLQNAVDAAATSAAIDYMFNASQTTATTAANSAITANGFSVTPTVNFYPNIISTYHNNGDYYVQVIASVPDPTFFIGVFHGLFNNTSGAQESVTIAASAIAGLPGRGNACVIILDPHAADAMQLQGSFDVSADDCGVVVDSDSSDALQFTGAGGTLSAGYVSVVGDGHGGGDGGQTGDSDPAPVLGATPVNNPFPSLTGPTAADCTAAGANNATTTLKSTTVYTTKSGLTCFTNAVTMSGTVTLPSGVVVFENGVTLGGTVNSGTNGTTIDMLGGAFDVGTGTDLNLTAPTTAPTTGTDGVPSGIIILQPISNTNEVKLQAGDAYGQLTGITYAPGAELYLQDSGGDKNGGITMTTDLIVDTLYDKTSTLTIHSYTTAFGSSSPLTAVALVE